MANAITWSDLLEIYQNVDWTDGDAVELTIATEGIVETLLRVEASDRAFHEADIAVLSDPAKLTVGSKVEVRVGAPQLRHGVLVKDWDALLASLLARMREPPAFFIKADKTHSATQPPTDMLRRYRAVIKLVDILGKSALFADVQHAKLVYFSAARVEVPVRFAAKDVRGVDPAEVDELEKALEGDVHSEQRFGILADAVVELVSSQSTAGRFHYLIQNVDEVVRRVKDGYRLFASSFSYSKIRLEVEKNQSEYVARIHKTFGDIQGQLLGLPVASVVVATQLKVSQSCGPALLANVAILGGALLFAALLIASCINQWMTLDAIARELKAQRSRLETAFSEIKGIFAPNFDALDRRICWHRLILFAVSLVSLAGAAFTARAYMIVTDIDAWACLVGSR